MKLRLQSNSIRLRLKRAEVGRLAETGRIAEQIVMGVGADEVFCYALEASDGIDTPEASLTNTGISVRVPKASVLKWAMGDEIGIEACVPAGSQQLQILIEKDFACLNGPPEQNIDTFPHPLAGTKC